MNGADRPLRVGVVGYGFGRFHVATFAAMPDVELVAVADSARFDEVAAAARRGGFTPYRDALAMLAEAGLDAVSLCVPPARRRDLIAAALAADLAIFVEKPWASDPDQARELADLCAGSRRPVMVGFSFRFHPAITCLRELLDGPLGAVRMLAGSYVGSWLPPAGHWTWDPANGNGFINENACHLFNAVCYLMGSPCRVVASGNRFTGAPAEDAAAVQLQFADGAIASLTCGGIGAAAFTSYPQLTVWTAAGQAELLGDDHVWRELRWARSADPGVGHQVLAPEALGRTRYADALQVFVDAVRSGAPSPVPPAVGVQAVELAAAVTRSVRSGSPVDLPIR